MAINFDSFTERTTSNIQSNDYVVGFDTAVPGGERKFTLSTIANAVSGIIAPAFFQTAPYNGFVFVPLNDPTDPLNNNSNAAGINVIGFAATGNTTATPYTGATQTANLASIVPDNAYMVLVRIFTNSNLFSNTGEIIFVRKNTSGSWSQAGEVEGIGTGFETSQTWTMPIIFDRTSKSFQAYYYDPKSAGAPTSAPAYYMIFDVLGYYIK